MTLRGILITLGLVVAVLPYAGIPYSIAHWVYTFSGFSVVFLLTVSKKERGRSDARRDEDAPRSLHVERTEVEDYPRVHIERSITTDTERVEETPNTETEIEKTITVVRRKKRKNDVSSSEETPLTP